MFFPSPLALFDYVLGAPQTKQATRSTKIIGVTFTEALAKCSNSEVALQKGMKRGDVYVNPRGFYCFRQEEDRIDRILSDATAAKSSNSVSAAEAEQLAEFMKQGEFGWASTMIRVLERPSDIASRTTCINYCNTEREVGNNGAGFARVEKACCSSSASLTGLCDSVSRPETGRCSAGSRLHAKEHSCVTLVGSSLLSVGPSG